MNQRSLFAEAEQKADLSQWYTPRPLAKRIVDWALSHNPGCRNIVEPAAGQGALVKPLLERGLKVTAYDIDPANVAALCEIPGRDLVVHCNDWLGDPPLPAAQPDMVVMNPPFEYNNDVTFVAQAVQAAPVAISVLRGVVLHGVGRWEIAWRWVDPVRLVYLVRRPKWGGDHSPKQDFIIAELRPRETQRQDGEIIRPLSIEWWL